MVLRCAVAVVFVAHGVTKPLAIWGSAPAATSAVFDPLGLQPSQPLAILIGLVELLGGVMLMAGALTFWTAAMLVLDVFVALWKVHLGNGFFINWTLQPGVGHGLEFHLVLIAALVSLMLTGAGELSLDGCRMRSAEQRAFGRARLRDTH
ncbi:MAG: DoxX family protein [Acidobacteria bacterium]|nr:DoxX family protein [Acidobacteriota bacterium]